MIQSIVLLSTTINATGGAITDINPGSTFQGAVTGTGAVSVTITIQGSLDKVNWVTLGAMSLSGTTTATDGFVSQGEWYAYRAVTSSATGTISSIVALMSVV